LENCFKDWMRPVALKQFLFLFAIAILRMINIFNHLKTKQFIRNQRKQLV